MLFSEYYRKACEEVIDCRESGVWFLEPDWRAMLKDASLTIDKISNRETNEEILFEMLKLQVEKMNAIENKIKIVTDWLSDVVTTVVDPAIVEKENEIAEQIMENSEVKDGDREIDEEKLALDMVENIKDKTSGLLNFAKKTD